MPRARILCFYSKLQLYFYYLLSSAYSSLSFSAGIWSCASARVKTQRDEFLKAGRSERGNPKSMARKIPTCAYHTRTFDIPNAVAVDLVHLLSLVAWLLWLLSPQVLITNPFTVIFLRWYTFISFIPRQRNVPVISPACVSFFVPPHLSASVRDCRLPRPSTALISEKMNNRHSVTNAYLAYRIYISSMATSKFINY